MFQGPQYEEEGCILREGEPELQGGRAQQVPGNSTRELQYILVHTVLIPDICTMFYKF